MLVTEHSAVPVIRTEITERWWTQRWPLWDAATDAIMDPEETYVVHVLNRFLKIVREILAGGRDRFLCMILTVYLAGRIGNVNVQFCSFSSLS